MYKVCTRIILERMLGELDENQPREQAGFRAGFRTSDHLHTLSQVIEKAKEYRFNICLGFIDYEKAFNSLDHLSLLQALKNQVRDTKYIRPGNANLQSSKCQNSSREHYNRRF